MGARLVPPNGARMEGLGEPGLPYAFSVYKRPVLGLGINLWKALVDHPVCRLSTAEPGLATTRQIAQSLVLPIGYLGSFTFHNC
jgi:hypothetical protein